MGRHISVRTARIWGVEATRLLPIKDRLSVLSLTPVDTGVDAVLANGPGSVVYYSSDGLNLGGGDHTTKAYLGDAKVLQIVPMGAGDAVVTLFANGTAFYSPDNRNLGGGGNTVPAAGPASIAALVPVGGGILAQFESGSVYLSPDGKNLAGGGSSVSVDSWDDSIANGPFTRRDSAHGAIFLDSLWLSGGFSDPTGANSCFVTCSFYDLWSSTDAEAPAWNTAPRFATASGPDPRDATPVVNNGVQDSPLPTDFYDSYTAIIVWNGRLTAIGSTVWRSPDGVTWTRDNLSDGTASPGPLPAPQRATENSRALISATCCILFSSSGGRSIAPQLPMLRVGPIWARFRIHPAVRWNRLCSGREIWIEGGGACDYTTVYNDIWSSPDGVHWTPQPTSAAWFGRMWPCVATGDGIVWLAGGYAPTDWLSTDGTFPWVCDNHADVWYSRDGIDWKQFKADIGSGLPDDGKLEPRHAPTCYFVGADATARSLIIIAGTGGTSPNAANAATLNSIRRLPLPEAALLP